MEGVSFDRPHRRAPSEPLDYEQAGLTNFIDSSDRRRVIARVMGVRARVVDW
jgi:hypothetical protein